MSAELRDEMMNKKLVFIRFNKSGWLAAGGAGAAKMLGWGRAGRAVTLFNTVYGARVVYLRDPFLLA